MPPEAQAGFLSRPRLLHSLARRWDHRVTALVGGAGLGKTTLLAQAVAENRHAARGRDVWVSLEPLDDHAERLASLVAAALTQSDGDQNGAGPEDDDEPAGPDAAPTPGPASGSGGHAPEPARLAELLWQRSPEHTCVILDDVHYLTPRSCAAAWLEQLITHLPANGHIVLASRTEPPVPLTRLSLGGGALLLNEHDLVFNEDEAAGFAAQRGLDPTHLHDTGGWPAMAALTATLNHHLAGKYLWDEILEPLGAERRRVLAVLCDLNGADDQLMSAALGTPTDLARALDGIPLISRSADGWYRPHRLWRTAPAPGLELNDAERFMMRRRAAQDLCQRGRFDDAFTLAQTAGHAETAATVLRDACVEGAELMAGQLGQWLSASSDAVRTYRGWRLAASLHTALIAPGEAIPPLQASLKECREAGDVDAELTVISQLALLGWWQQDLMLLSGIFPRVMELEEAGHPRARGLAALGRAVGFDLIGSYTRVDKALAGIESVPLDPAWKGYVGWLWGLARLNGGDAEGARDIADRFGPTTARAHRYMLDALRLSAWWAEGRMDDVLAGIPAVAAHAKRTGQKSNLYFGLSLASLVHSFAGDTAKAATYLEGAVAGAPPQSPDKPGPPVPIAVSRASLLLAEGDEQQARDVLRAAVDTHRLDKGLSRHAWRSTLCLTYILLPETRKHWDDASLRGHLHTARELASLVAELREGGGKGVESIELPSLRVIRTVLHVRFAAELAVGLASVGRPEGPTLLDELGPSGRTAVRDAGTGSTRLAKSARALLAAVPAPPPRPTYIAVLGPLLILGDRPHSSPANTPDLRRRKVHALLAYLIQNRYTTRAAIGAALWPDLPESAANNNLSVTLNHLLRILEPWRTPGEPPFLVRTDGPTLSLSTGSHLLIDTDIFTGHLTAAAEAEADGTPTIALDHYLAAIELYRDTLHQDLDLDTAPWLTLDREHYRSRFITTATRAAQLLHHRGDTHHAQSIAQRVLEIDPGNEAAYTAIRAADPGARSQPGRPQPSPPAR